MTFPQIFSDLKVLDFSRLLPGPFASELLIKMGAQVTCILPPEGDPLLGNYSPFESLRAGKSFVELDLKSPDGLKQVLERVEQSDLLLEGFRPGAMDRLGLGFEQARKRNGKLLYVSLSGYGPQDSKYLLGAHDLNFLVDSGVYSLLFSDDSTEVPLIQLADLMGGLYAVLQILMEWIARGKEPKAKHLRVSIVEGMKLLARYLQDPGVEKLVPILTGGLARYHIFTTQDGQRIAIAAIEPKFFENVMKAMGLTYDGQSDGDEVIRAMEAAFSGKNLEQWRQQLSHIDGCISFIPTRSEVLAQSKKASATS